MGLSVKMEDNSKEVINAKDKAVLKALYAIGMHIEGEAKEELNNSPRRIDTGLLRNSITFALSGEATQITSYSGDNPSRSKPDGPIPSGSYSGRAPNDPKDKPAVYIGTNVEYGVYVHEGSQRMEPNRFLKNAVDRNKDQLEQYVKRELENA